VDRHPVTQLGGDETKRLLHMEEALHKRIVGQDEAIDTISKAVRRARAGLKDPRHPSGTSFSWDRPVWVRRAGPRIGRVHVWQ